MLLNYMKQTNSHWNRSSIRMSKTEYKALSLICEKIKMSPTSYIENQYILYNENKGDSTNFTAYLRDSMFKNLIGE